MALKVKLLTLAFTSGIAFVSNAAVDINLNFQEQINSTRENFSRLISFSNDRNSLLEHEHAPNSPNSGLNISGNGFKTRSCLSDPNKCK